MGTLKVDLLGQGRLREVVAVALFLERDSGRKNRLHEVRGKKTRVGRAGSSGFGSREKFT